MATMGRKPRDVDVPRLVADYLGGMSVRECAAAHGVSYGTVYKRFQDTKTPMRPRGVNLKRSTKTGGDVAP